MQMLPTLMAHPRVRLSACAEPDAPARERFAADFGATPYEDAKDLCVDPKIDAVYIATPHQFHRDHAVMAADAGKHIVVEKPMALTLADCDVMIAAAKRNRVRMLIGHTHSFDPPVLKAREIIRSGALGPVALINTFNYTPFLYRPRRPEELRTELGGGIIYNQVPHQIDTVRLLGGGMVRSVRAMAWALDSERPTEGSQAAFLQFEDGAAATVVYSGYDHFNSDEVHDWVAEGGARRGSDGHGSVRQALRNVDSPAAEAALKGTGAYAGKPELTPPSHHPHFGVTIVSCAGGDIRTSADGVTIYSADGRVDVPVPLGRAYPDKATVIDELYDAITNDREPVHNGRWGKATMEVTLAILESAQARQEISLTHQVPA